MNKFGQTGTRLTQKQREKKEKEAAAAEVSAQWVVWTVLMIVEWWRGRAACKEAWPPEEGCGRGRGRGRC